MARLVRYGLILGVFVTGALLAGPGRRLAGLFGAGAVLLVVAAIILIIARLAHRAFEHGDHRQAAAFYRILRMVALDAGTRAAIDVSLAGCRLARDDFGGALAELRGLDPEVMAPSSRAAWLNNMAYARGRGGAGDSAAFDPAAGLGEVDEAMKIRPDVAGYRHTRGVVLMALGRLDDAIAELDRVWPHLADDKAPPAPLLEAERCFDLATAWARKGELDYARDYFHRARSVAPRSSWATRAAQWLDAHPGPTPGPAHVD